MTRNSVLRPSNNRSTRSHPGLRQGLLALAAASIGIAAVPPGAAPAAPNAVRRPAQITPTAKKATRLGAVPATQTIDLDLTLPLRNKAQLDALIMRLSDPMDSQYKHYLTPEQFAQEFGPTQADYAALTDFAVSQGLTITQRSKSRLLLHVQGTAAQVGTAFGIQVNRYARPDGSAFYAADNGPLLPRGLAARGANVIGLTDFARPTPQFVPASSGVPSATGVPVPEGVRSQAITPSGPEGFLAPSDVTGYYDSVSTATYNGAGQSVALVEFNTYNPADVVQYINKFGVGENTHFYKELVGGYVEPPYDGSVSGQEEVTLDVDMLLIFAPQLEKCYVYEGSSSQSVEAQIADDDQVSAVSISWASQEDPNNTGEEQAENALFAQMAAEGMSVFAAAGDTGAYNDTGNHVPGDQIVVQDPASQPWVTGVGGTKINSNSIGQLTSEVAWTSGGGGVSQVWSLPPYQTALLGVTSDSQLSTTMRNVPDLSANAGTGYAIYFNSAWQGVDGTSAAAPLWAGYVARYNQYNAQNGDGPSGNINALLYADYANSFLYNNSILKDITSGDNGVFSAAGGYDNVTGLGTMQHDWIVSPTTATVTALSAPGGGVYGQPLTFPATVTPYAPVGAVSGTLEFYENTTLTGLGVSFGSTACTDGQGALVYNALPVGKNYVSVAYAGGGAFSGSDSSAQSVVITPGLASPTFSVSPSTPTVGQPFTVTATVSPTAPSTLTPTGKVQFTDAAGNVLGEYNLSSGIAYVNLTETAAGSFIIKGQYEGNGGYAPTAINPLTVVIGRATTTTALNSPSTARVGQSIALTATVTGFGTPTGTVTFTDGSATLGMATLSGGTARLNTVFMSAGSHTIRAAYSGDSANAASSASGTVTVALSTTIAAVVTLQGVAAGNLAQPLTVTLTPTGSTGGSVTTQTVTPAAADGSFSLSGVPAGTYIVGVKGSKWLRKDVSVDTTGGNVTGLSVSLLGGDANGDNQVTALDLLAVKNAYNTVLGDPHYNAAADFNCDGQVTALDLLIVKLNYNKTGDR